MVTSCDTLVEIVKEASKLSSLEQQIFLTKLRVKRLRKRGIGNLANPPKNGRKPGMKQIDKWKHDAKVKSIG